MGLLSYIREEIGVIRDRDPAIHSDLEVLLYPSFKVLLYYQVAHRLYKNKHYFLARWVSQRGARKTGIEIHPGAKLGKGLFIDHGHGVVIGETAVVGDNVTMYQGVTLGGTGKEHGKRHPTIGNNVMISTGAQVLGSFHIGDNSKIGAGSVVLDEVPPNSTVVGVPGRVVKSRQNVHPQEEMDQVHLPDPVQEDLALLQQENEALTNRVIDLERSLRRLERKYKALDGETAAVKGSKTNTAATGKAKTTADSKSKTTADSKTKTASNKTNAAVTNTVNAETNS